MLGMGQKPIAIGEVEAAAIDAVHNYALDRGISDRALSLGAGITETRGRALLRHERPTTVGEFVDICDFLGLIAWQILRDVQQQPMPSYPFRAEDVPEERKAAKKAPYDPRLEEEQQPGPEWGA
jgi:hypothetical protein